MNYIGRKIALEVIDQFILLNSCIHSPLVLRTLVIRRRVTPFGRKGTPDRHCPDVYVNVILKIFMIRWQPSYGRGQQRRFRENCLSDP